MYFEKINLINIFILNFKFCNSKLIKCYFYIFLAEFIKGNSIILIAKLLMHLFFIKDINNRYNFILIYVILNNYNNIKIIRKLIFKGLDNDYQFACQDIWD